MTRVALVLVSCALLLGAIELGLRHELFARVSYSNSQSIDRQLAERDASDRWRILFVGDSEFRWGVDPAQVDAALRRRGVDAPSFNHSFDGFGASWWPILLPPLLEQPSLRRVEVVVLGVQMIDAHRPPPSAPGLACGALQKPVLTSSFGVDLGLDSLCRNDTWDAALGRRLFSWLWTVRYASAVRALLVPAALAGQPPLRFNSRKSGESYRGFEPHRAIAADRADYAGEFRRWKAQYDPLRDFRPLPAGVWEGLTAKDGLFDQVLRAAAAGRRALVLVALPTNPVVIDTFRRREDYARHARLLKRWARERGVIFLDFGIQDVADPEHYFSDMRHLSAEGARVFSRRLGDALAESLSGRRWRAD